MKLSIASSSAFFTFSFITALLQVNAAAIVSTNPDSVIPSASTVVVLPRQINQPDHSDRNLPTTNTTSTESALTNVSPIAKGSFQTPGAGEFTNDDKVGAPATIKSCMALLDDLEGAEPTARAPLGSRGPEGVKGIDGKSCTIEWSADYLDRAPPRLRDLAVVLKVILTIIGLAESEEVTAVLKNIRLNGVRTDICVFDAGSKTSSCREQRDV